MSGTVKSVVFGALLYTTSLPAIAQTTDTPIVSQPSEQVGATVEQPAPKSIQGQIVLQSNGTVLANDLIGSNVYNANDEVVGEISDLIINISGSVDGVVIGVGGFLGIGKKKIAVEMSAITLVTPENEDVRLALNATREDLEAAEGFKTTARQEMEKQTEQEAAELGENLLGTKPLPPAN